MESSSRTLVCSVLFLDIVEYSKKAVADQIQLKQAFNQVLAKAVEEVAPRDRIILDTGDGAAVTFMGDPEDALFAAISVRDMAAAYAEGRGPLAVRLGVKPDINAIASLILLVISLFTFLAWYFTRQAEERRRRSIQQMLDETRPQRDPRPQTA